jgi:excisionase family DNA binding protein
MDLTLTQAAQLLGKTRRQVEYLIKTGRLPAKKVGTHWVVEDSDLPLSPAQRQAQERKTAALHAVAEEVLGATTPKIRYSLRDLKAFREGLALVTAGRDQLPEAHPALPLLRQALDALAIGCHRFERRGKAEAYGRARDQASLAACALLVDAPPGGEALVAGIEQTLIPAIAGLLRRAERSSGGS